MFRSCALALTACSLAGCLLAGPAQASPLAKKLSDHYLKGQRTQAAALLAKHSSASAWSRTRSATVSAVFHSRKHGLTLTAERAPGASQSEEIIVAFPPGTFAVPHAKSRRYDPLPQDLLLLRAPVLTLKAGEQKASLRVPVACASFRRKGPQPSHGYSLRSATLGSNLDRLAQVLCAGNLPPTRELALAIWIGHEQLSYDRLAASAGFHTFPTPREKVKTSDGLGAARILRRAKIDASRLKFYREAGRAGQELLPPPGKQSPETKPRARPQSKPQPDRKPASLS